MLKAIIIKLKKRALFKKYKWSVEIVEINGVKTFHDILVPIDEVIDPAIESGAIFNEMFIQCAKENGVLYRH